MTTHATHATATLPHPLHPPTIWSLHCSELSTWGHFFDLSTLGKVDRSNFESCTPHPRAVHESCTPHPPTLNPPATHASAPPPHSPSTHPPSTHPSTQVLLAHASLLAGWTSMHSPNSTPTSQPLHPPIFHPPIHPSPLSTRLSPIWVDLSGIVCGVCVCVCACCVCACVSKCRCAFWRLPCCRSCPPPLPK